MGREIKFKGKRVDNGEWVFGYVVKTKDATFICYDNQYNDDLFLSPENIFIEVIPETVGQFTGLCDKEGKPIYEGDIVKFDDDEPNEHLVEYKSKYGEFYLRQKYARAGLQHAKYAIVIGNIHDNPSLINIQQQS